MHRETQEMYQEPGLEYAYFVHQQLRPLDAERAPVYVAVRDHAVRKPSPSLRALRVYPRIAQFLSPRCKVAACCFKLRLCCVRLEALRGAVMACAAFRARDPCREGPLWRVQAGGRIRATPPNYLHDKIGIQKKA